MNKCHLIIALLAIALPFNSFSQEGSKMLSPKKMQKDLQELLENIDAHPDPYTKITKPEFDQLVSAATKNISEPLDYIDYYKNLATIVSSIGDGHSGFFMPRGWLENMRKNYGVFPYEVFLTNAGDLHVIKSYGNDKIPMGSKITAIEGMPIDDFINQVSQYLYYETDDFRNDRITESFEFLLYLVFKTSAGLNFSFKNTSEGQAAISTIPFKEWKTTKKDQRENRENKMAKGINYDFKIIKPGVAKIDIFSFAVRNFDDYNRFLLKTFKEIREENVHSLIIDVRGNYGGWPKVASELFHYIHEGYFKTMAKSSMKLSKAYRSYFFERVPGLRTANYTIPPRRHYLDLTQILNGKTDTYIDEEAFFNEEPITEKFEFTGDCYLLIDRKSYSASSSFAATFQCYSMGQILGEPTGGTKVFRANPYAKVLPATSFVLRISTTKLYSACFNEDNEPVIPNIKASPSIIDRINGIDSQLNYALMLIKRMQKRRAESAEK